MGGGYTIYAFPACYRKMLCGTENFVFVQLYCVFVFCTRIGLFFGGVFQIAAGFWDSISADMLPAVKYAVIPVSGKCGGSNGGWDNSFLVCCPCEKVTFIKQGLVIRFCWILNYYFSQGGIVPWKIRNAVLNAVHKILSVFPITKIVMPAEIIFTPQLLHWLKKSRSSVMSAVIEVMWRIG